MSGLDNSKVPKQAVVKKKETKSDGSTEEQAALFNIQGASKNAGNWINGVKRDLEARFGKVDVHPAKKVDIEEDHKQGKRAQSAKPKKEKKDEDKKKNMWDRMGGENKLFDKVGKNLEQIHPLHVMNEGVKSQARTIASGNKRKIAALLVESSLYCTAFHHTKQGLKRITKDRKYSGPTVRYVSDVMLPNSIYGPIFGFLIRLTLPF